MNRSMQILARAQYYHRPEINDIFLATINTTRRQHQYIIDTHSYHCELAGLIAYDRRDYKLRATRAGHQALQRLVVQSRSDNNVTARRATAQLIQQFITVSNSFKDCLPDGPPTDLEYQQIIQQSKEILFEAGYQITPAIQCDPNATPKPDNEPETQPMPNEPKIGKFDHKTNNNNNLETDKPTHNYHHTSSYERYESHPDPLNQTPHQYNPNHSNYPPAPNEPNTNNHDYNQNYNNDIKPFTPAENSQDTPTDTTLQCRHY